MKTFNILFFLFQTYAQCLIEVGLNFDLKTKNCTPEQVHQLERLPDELELVGEVSIPFLQKELGPSIVLKGEGRTTIPKCQGLVAKVDLSTANDRIEQVESVEQNCPGLSLDDLKWKKLGRAVKAGERIRRSYLVDAPVVFPQVPVAIRYEKSGVVLLRHGQVLRTGIVGDTCDSFTCRSGLLQ